MENTKVKCPICGKDPETRYAPFCSKKCADVDLGRWLKGSYVVHTDEKPEDISLVQEEEE